MNNENMQDDIATMTAKMVKAADALYTTVDNERVELVKKIFATMKEIVEDRDANITMKLFEPFKDCGSVSVIGRDINIHDTKRFAEAVASCTIFDVYPRTDGTVRMDFSFRNLMKMDGE